MPFYDNAINWGTRAQQLGYTVNSTPAVGAIAWTTSPGHVAWVEAVNGSTVTVEEYNYLTAYGYGERTIAASSASYIHFRDLNTLADGMYKASNESAFYLVKNGVRRQFSWGIQYQDWIAYPPPNAAGINLNNVQTIDPAVLYSSTQWAPAIPYLVRNSGQQTVYWVALSVNPNAMGQLVAKAVASPTVMQQMGFDFNDVCVVLYDPAVRFGLGSPVNAVQPRLVTTDGPYCTHDAWNYFGGFRVRNLSTDATTPISVTIRAYQLRNDGSATGYWFDFPWSSINGLDKNLPDGWVTNPWPYVSAASIPSGRYAMKVIYSYWSNFQYESVIGGERPYPDASNIFVK